MGKLAVSLTLACLVASLANSGALAGLHLNRGLSSGKGCGDMVTLKHPELKGKARKAEWDKCMANPGGYNG